MANIRECKKCGKQCYGKFCWDCYSSRESQGQGGRYPPSRQRKKYKKLLHTFLLVIFSGVLSALLFIPVETDSVSYDYKERFDADNYGYVAGTGSMKPFINVNDTMYYLTINATEPLYIGVVYVFKRVNGSTIHRLVGFANDEKTKLIFKGDNNNFVDKIVDRSNVTKELIAVCFRGHCKKR